MERRSFLKGLFGLYVSLSPAASIIKGLTTDTAPLIADAYGITWKNVGELFIITVENKSALSVLNTDVLGAFKYLSNDIVRGDGLKLVDGELKEGYNPIEIKIKGDQSHKDMLKSFMVNPLKIGKMVLCSETTNQVLSTIVLSNRDSNGNIFSYPIMPGLFTSPYDLLDTQKIISITNSFLIDGLTSLVVSEMLPKTKMDIMLYPLTDINFNRW